VVDNCNCLYALYVNSGTIITFKKKKHVWHSESLTLSPERQSARMSKITNNDA